ncbi:MAG: NAD(P)-dependent oxidoreductase [Polyangiaceae bacterium]|nr:NAD(P)-dependent oxidoreductase [Polyangiaceae bacterium]
MKIFVAGATGAIGQRLLPQLIARGHQVTAMTRSQAKVEPLRALGAEAVVVDGLDAVAVGEAVARAEPDAIVHQMTSISGTADLRHFDRWFAATNALRTRGTEHLLAAARASGVRQFVAQSYTGWTNARTGGPVKTEVDPFDDSPAKAQRETMAAIRFLEQAVLAAPLEGVALRYGNFYGPGASDALVDMVRKRKMPIVGGGGGVWSWIHLDDAASATVIALERGLRGIYNVTDEEPAPVAEWLPYLAKVVGAKPPMHVPAWVGRLLAGEVPTRWMTEGRGSSSEKLRAATDWRPRWRTWRDGFRFGLTESSQPPARAA